MNIEIPDYSQTRLLVVGDVMLDRYWYGDTSRISPEAPVPVVKIKQIEERPGGAANVALNVRALGAHVGLLGLIGQDGSGNRLAQQLEAADVHSHLQRLEGVPTITKLRVLSRHQQLIRLDFEDSHYDFDQADFLKRFQSQLSNVHGVIFSDYDKGALRDIKPLVKLACEANLPVFVDPKQDDFSLYHGATVVTPNFKEFQAIVGVCRTEEEIVEKGQALLHQHDLQALLITRGEHGMTLLCKDEPEFHVPTRAREVFDVTGAGDTVVATLALMHAAGLGLADAVTVANTAAGVAVSKLGAATVSLPELQHALHGGQGEPGGVVTEDQLALLLEAVRARGETIVFTNGCFDILHAGHVQYLEEAKALGDHLIVAVNSDASVKQLKGSGRPLNTLEKRMAVLSGLAAVDWAVPFSEETPERLIKKLLPDVLTKGGDYKVEEIAGSDAVLKNGGKVEILSFVDGLSTTGLIKQINKNVDGD